MLVLAFIFYGYVVLETRVNRSGLQMLSCADRFFWLVCGKGSKGGRGRARSFFYVHQKSSLYSISKGGLRVSDLQSLISTLALHFTTSQCGCCVIGV